MGPTGHRAPALLALVGPTASGKTAVALALAERFGAHVANYDSVQLYRGLEIGAAKPPPAERARYPHHLYEMAGPEREMTAGAYGREAGPLIEGLLARGERVVLVGGTGLYLRALCHGLAGAPASEPEVRRRIRERFEGACRQEAHRALMEVDPEAARRIGPGDFQRISRALEVYEQTGRPLSRWQREHGFATKRFSPVLLGLAGERETLYKKIDRRSAQMVEAGLVGEVEGLLKMGYRPGGRALSSIGYRHVLAHLAGRCSLEQMVGEIATQTRRYAKRQITWWRRQEAVRWLPGDAGAAPFARAAAEFWDGPGERQASG